MGRRHGFALAALMLVAACGGGGGTGVTASPTSTGTPWPAPPNALDLARKAGLVPEVKEFLLYHVHAHLHVFINGAAVLVPAGVGINISDPAVQHGTSATGPTYGGISLCAQPCISPLHTHDTSGVLHTESKASKPNKLGQLFIEWNVKLDANCVGDYCKPQTPIAVYVDGSAYSGNPADIELTNFREIAIVIGTPPAGGVPNKYFQ